VNVTPVYGCPPADNSPRAEPHLVTGVPCEFCGVRPKVSDSNFCSVCLLNGHHNLTKAQHAIVAECDALKAMLLEKNRAYGNSALEPVRIFSKASPEEQILVRIDDKINRLMKGSEAGEDVVQDLIGYLVLLRIARRKPAP